VLGIDGVMYMLDMQFYVHVVLPSCCTCGAMYIWCGVHDFESGVVYIWRWVHIVQVVLCAGGVA